MELRPEFCKHIPETLEEGILYVSEEYETAIHLCPCGCKCQSVTPFSSGQWTYLNEDGKITLNPSVGNRFPCKSHYFIRKNEIVMA